MNDKIEVVRGRLSDERANQLVRFWVGTGALDEPAAHRRLPEVVCVLLDDAGEVAGVNSVFADEVALVGGRRFWIYRSALPEGSGAGPAMVRAAFDALEKEFDPEGSDPIGLCLLLAGGVQVERRSDAEWADPRLLYAGYLGDGRQVRIAYFKGAKISPGGASTTGPAPQRNLDEGYRIHLFAEQDAVGEQAVTELWAREQVVSQREARERIHQVLFVATGQGGELVAVASAYLQRNPQLGMDLWHYRTFVTKAHRTSNLAVNLAVAGRDHLENRFVTGEDTRAAGILTEVENEGLKRHLTGARWRATNFTFIGENERGDHVRIHYFAGAQAPGFG